MQDVYEARRAEYLARAAALEARSRLLSIFRGASFLSAVGLPIEALAWPASGHAAVSFAGGALALVAFVALVVVHGRVIARRDRAQAGARLCVEGLARIAGKLAELPSRGEPYAREEHPYSDDLDVFGKASVFVLVDRTTTRHGEALLASWLLSPAAPDVVRSRQEAVRELAPRVDWRQELALDGLGDEAEDGGGGRAPEARADLERLARWAGGGPTPGLGPRLLLVAWGLPLVTLALAAAAAPLGLPGWSFAVAAAVTYATHSLLARRLAPVLEAASGLRDALGRIAAQLERIESASFAASLLVERQHAMRDTSGHGAHEQMRTLASIAGFLDARRNDLFRAGIAPFLQWDVHWCLALERWRARSGARVGAWLDAVAHVEALGSLASVAFEHPDWCFAELVDGDACFAAEALGHPLIAGAARVTNDVTLPRGVLLVTGSNMSGKSTLLRSIGLAAVMAQAGGPSCAHGLKMSALAVRSSMRVRDSVEEGVSRFYAELIKIRRVVEGANAGGVPVLFLLDEILSGTNSFERHAGARALVRALVGRGAIGAVSTHDLALAGLADELPDRARLVCFEEQVEGDEMSFDYRLRDGVVRTRNALRLMRRVGLPVPEAEPASGSEAPAAGEPDVAG